MSRLSRGITGAGSISRHGASQSVGGGAGGHQSNKSFEELKRIIHGKLVDKLDLSRVSELEGDTLKREIRLVVEHLCDSEDTMLNRQERERLIEEVLDETFGLGPLELLLKDPTISDILINGPKQIYCERRGKLEKTSVTFRGGLPLPSDPRTERYRGAASRYGDLRRRLGERGRRHPAPSPAG